jgi:hypothetical protein
MRANVAQTQCWPTVLVIFVSTVDRSIAYGTHRRQSPTGLASVAASCSNNPKPCRSQVISLACLYICASAHARQPGQSLLIALATAFQTYWTRARSMTEELELAA